MLAYELTGHSASVLSLPPLHGITALSATRISRPATLRRTVGTYGL